MQRSIYFLLFLLLQPSCPGNHFQPHSIIKKAVAVSNSGMMTASLPFQLACGSRMFASSTTAVSSTKLTCFP